MHAEGEDRGVLEIEVAAEDLGWIADGYIRVVAQQDSAKIGNLALSGKSGTNGSACRQLIRCLDMRTHVFVTLILGKERVVVEKGLRVRRIVLGMGTDPG